MTDPTPTQDTITARLERLAEWYEEPSYPRDFAQGKALIAADIRAILSECATLKAELEEARGAVQAFLDMVNVMQRVQALPIPAILETAQHNCPIILERIDAALATKEPTNV